MLVRDMQEAMDLDKVLLAAKLWAVENRDNPNADGVYQACDRLSQDLNKYRK